MRLALASFKSKFLKRKGSIEQYNNNISKKSKHRMLIPFERHRKCQFGEPPSINIQESADSSLKDGIGRGRRTLITSFSEASKKLWSSSQTNKMWKRRKE